MATVTIRNLSAKLVRALKTLARHHHRSMERDAHDIHEQQVGDRLSAVSQIEKAWALQKRSPTAEEIESWIATGRP
jgi:plasmid stability protein